MGEGNPGEALNPEFYMAARELTLKHDSALCIDSVQAGIRTTGNLSLCDFPGFETLPPPDFEVFSKALNGGQFPMSVCALSPRGASWYRHGIYGNTMTGNPRACRVATAALKQLTPELRANIRDMGKYCVERYNALMKELPEAIIRVNGTGLLYQVKLNPKFQVTAMDGIERTLRQRGLNVIHGGTNAIRFTPNFDITKEEVDLQVELVREVLLEKLGKKVPLAQLKLFWERLSAHNESTFSGTDIDAVVALAKVDGNGLVDVSEFIDDIFKGTGVAGA